MTKRISVLLLALLGDEPPTVRYFESLAQSIDRRRFRLVVGTIRNPGRFQSLFESHGHTTFCLNCCSRRQYAGAVLKLVRIICQERIDILHGNEELGGFLCGLAGTIVDIPVRIYHRHHDRTLAANPEEGHPNGLSQLRTINYRLLDTLAGWLADRVLVVSEHHRQTVLLEHSRWARKIGVALNGSSLRPDLEPDREDARRIRGELGIAPGTPVLTIVARVNWRKGHAVLLRAMQHLKRDRGLEPDVLVVGHGPLAAELRQMADHLELGRVHFVGNQNNVLPWFLAADVAVVPSVVEPFGLVATEAMSCARAVVASRVGGLQEIVIDGETGMLVPPADPLALAGAIEKLLRDPELAVRMGQAGRKRFETVFTAEAMVRRWEAHYLDALAKKQASEKIG